MQPAILVGNRTGGQGKTLVSHILHYAYGLAGIEMKAVSADTSEDGADQQSKLGRIIPDVEELGIGARLAEIRANPQIAVQYWDRIGGFLRKGQCIIDLGANILPLVFDWAQERNAGRVLRSSGIYLVVPVTAQLQSVYDAKEILDLTEKHKEALPIKKRYMILNEYHGKFDAVKDSPEFRRLLKSAHDGEIKIVNLERCQTEVWDRIEGKFMNFGDLANLDFMGFAERFKINEFAASGAQHDFITWLNKHVGEFRAAGLVPERADHPAKIVA